MKVLVHTARHSILQDLWAHLTRPRRHHPRRGIFIGIHEAERHHTVEPRVSHFLHHEVTPLGGDLVFQFLNLSLKTTEFSRVLSQDKFHLRSD